MKVPYRDLRVTDPRLRKEYLKAVEEVMTHGRLILGPETDILEGLISDFCGMKYCTLVGSGSSALFLALKALSIRPGDEVISTPLSWIATANAITLCGAKPVYADINDDLNIDPNAIKSCITPQTKAILPVHFNGLMCKMPEIMEIGKRYAISVVEDAAQAFGAEMNGFKSGGFGCVNCFSMNPMKIFGALGEAGAVLTDDPSIRDRVVMLRYAGTIDRENCAVPALNHKIDTLQAAMLLVQLRHLDRKLRRLREIARYYTKMLSKYVICPDVDDASHVFYTFTIITPYRDALKKSLESEGIETKILHPILMPDHKAYSHLPESHIPIARELVKKILSIPCHDAMSDDQVEYVAMSVKSYFETL